MQHFQWKGQILLNAVSKDSVKRRAPKIDDAVGPKSSGEVQKNKLDRRHQSLFSCGDAKRKYAQGGVRVHERMILGLIPQDFRRSKTLGSNNKRAKGEEISHTFPRTIGRKYSEVQENHEGGFIGSVTRPNDFFAIAYSS